MKDRNSAFYRFKKNRLALACVFVLGVLVAASLILTFFPVYSITEVDLSIAMQPPSLAHPFGTDTTGTDLMTKVFKGLFLTFLVGFVASIISLFIGLVYGSISGYFGKRTDNLMMRAVDVLYGLPTLAYVILIIFVFQTYGDKLFPNQEGVFSRSNLYLWNVFVMTIALGSIYWLTISRIVRAQVLGLQKMEFVEAARAIGAKHFRIIFKHIVPNLIGPVIVYTTLTAPSIMLFESFISFLGLGIKPPNASLGILIDDGIKKIAATNINWWLIFFPGMMLASIIFCLNAIGDGLRDAFDVR